MAKKVNKTIKKHMEQCSEASRKSGGVIEINQRLPYVSILCADGTEYFFQGYDAERLLNEVPDNVSPEDYLFWASSGW